MLTDKQLTIGFGVLSILFTVMMLYTFIFWYNINPKAFIAGIVGATAGYIAVFCSKQFREGGNKC